MYIQKFRTGKFLASICNLFTRQLKIELQSTKLHCLHITAGKQFHKKSVNREIPTESSAAISSAAICSCSNASNPLGYIWM